MEKIYRFADKAFLNLEFERFTDTNGNYNFEMQAEVGCHFGDTHLTITRHFLGEDQIPDSDEAIDELLNEMLDKLLEEIS